MTIDVAASTLFCLDKPLEEAIPDILLDETKYIEITDEWLHALNQPRVERLLELKSSYDLRYSVHAPFIDVNIAAHDPIIREAILRRLETSIKFSSALGAEALVFHPGSTSALEHFTPGMAWKLNLSSVDRLIKFAGEYNVPMMIENVPEPFPFLMKSVEDFERFYEEVGLDIKMVLDIAHASLRGESGIFLERLVNRVGHIHVSDNVGKFDEHLQLGKGSIDWKVTIEAIKSTGFSGWIVVESFKGVEESLRLLKRLLNED